MGSYAAVRESIGLDFAKTSVYDSGNSFFESDLFLTGSPAHEGHDPQEGSAGFRASPGHEGDACS